MTAMRAAINAALFIPQVVPAAPLHPLEWVTRKPEREEVRFPVPGGEALADLYRPAGSGRRAGLVVFLGANEAGREDPRALGLADGFARTGFTTLVYWSRSLVGGQIEPGDIDALVAAFTYLTQRPDVDPARVGFFGFCLGASYALIAAARPEIADRVAFVTAFAPYYSSRDLLRATASGTAFSDAGIRAWQKPWHRHADLRAAYEQALLSAIPDDAERARVATSAVDGASEPAGLSPAASAVFRLIKGVPLDRVDELLDLLPEQFIARLDQTSPRGQLAGLRARTMIIHGVADELVPIEESRRLVTALDPRLRPRYTEFELFDHVDPTRPVGTMRLIAELGKLFIQAYAIVRYTS